MEFNDNLSANRVNSTGSVPKYISYSIMSSSRSVDSHLKIYFPSFKLICSFAFGINRVAGKGK